MVKVENWYFTSPSPCGIRQSRVPCKGFFLISTFGKELERVLLQNLMVIVGFRALQAVNKAQKVVYAKIDKQSEENKEN